MDRVIELVVFSLDEEVDREDFLAAADSLSAWVREQPGFLSRELSYAPEGDRWIDVVWWRTMADAKAAAERALRAPECAPMFALIDARSTLMLHGELARSSPEKPVPRR